MIPKMELLIKGEKKILLRKGMQNDLKYEYKIPAALTAPIASGKMIGKIKVYLKDELKMEIPVKMPHNLISKGILDYFFDIFAEQNSYIEVKA